MFSLRRQVPVMLLASALAAGSCASAYAQAPTEYEVKAAFIHNIAKFVEWPLPSPADGKLRLCILGKDLSGGAFDTLQGKAVGNKIWQVSHVNADANLRKCAVLFIGASESGDLGRILEAIKDSAVLTVGDTRGYAEQDVMVNFYLEQNRVRFEINAGAARRAGLKIGSQLLRLGRLVAHQGSDK